MITPGIQYQLGNITIEGSYIFERQEVLELLGLEQFWGGSITFNLEEIRDGIENLKANYQKRGYWRVNISEPRITKDESTGLAHITIVIYEDYIRTLGKVDIKGLTAFEKK